MGRGRGRRSVPLPTPEVIQVSGRDKPAYKPGSPRWNDGFSDGYADRMRLCMNPPREPVGPMPPDPGYPKMYNLGYEAGFQGEGTPQ